MKLKTTLIIALIASTIGANAATYAFNNGASSTASGIVDETQRAFRSGTTVGQAVTGTGTFGNYTSAGAGVLAIGIFSTDDLASLTKTSLIAAFTNSFGPTFTFGAGPSGQRSSFAPAAQNSNIASTPLDDKFMYVFAGNGSTFADSTQFAVIKHSTSKFLAADDSNPNAITVSFTTLNSSLLFGTSVANVPTTNTDGTTTAGWAMMTPVPEASTSLLGAIGALALLRRRRN